MAFIRKRGGRYYLVHSVRSQDGRVKQIHLAPLGSRPHISERVIENVKSKHALVHVDWQGLKERVSQEVVQPFEDNALYLRELVGAIRNLNLDIADLHLPILEATMDPELRGELVTALKLLRTTLDVKLGRRRRSGPLTPER
ncbi:MAG: hypothetical protein ACLQOO_28150 [Terriglobia bacterium]